ncbi:MAG: hypothetical protein QXH32_02370 [Candidatus Caldarchaeum sp.]
MKSSLHDFILAWLNINTIEITLIRQKQVIDSWDLRSAIVELESIAKIVNTTKWPSELAAQVQGVVESLEEAIKTVRNKDSTRIKAAHTRLLSSVHSLRDAIRDNTAL